MNEALRVRHEDSYNRVPDRDRGDCGIEGYTDDGLAYQCYAPQEPLELDELYKKQRDKVTSDINKFVSKRDQLKRLLGDCTINKWILVVPRHESRRLNEFATAKAQEVRERNLPYASRRFRIGIEDHSDFPTERMQLTTSGRRIIQMDVPDIVPEDVDEWKSGEGESDLLETLNSKLSRCYSDDLSEEDQYKHIYQARDSLLKEYLRGRQILERLNENFPDLYQQIDRKKTAKERLLGLGGAKATSDFREFLQDEVRALATEIHDMKVIGEDQAISVAAEAVADWLMRCPLDFS